MFLEPIYFQMAALVLVMNLIPAFMPPTWLILAFFTTHFHLELFPVIIIGAVSATCGRSLLALLAKNYIRPYLPNSLRKNYAALGSFLTKNHQLTIPIVLTYAFFPIPSNQVFIITGLSKANIPLVALSFLIGRLISYSFWVNIADTAINKINVISPKNLPRTISVELISLIILLLLGMINWSQLLKVRK